MTPHPQLGKFLDWLLNHSLQAGVLVVVVLATQWIFRRQLTNRWRFALWWIVLARLLLPFSPESTVSLFNYLKPFLPPGHFASANPAQLEPIAFVEDTVAYPLIENFPPSVNIPHETAAESISPGSVPQAPSQPPSFHDLLIPILAGLWLAGVTVLCGMVVIQLVRFRLKLAQASMPSNPELQMLLDNCRREFGLARQIELLETDAVQSPALFGLRKPRLLLPRGMGSQFAGRELRYIFLHEIAHIKRGDLWLNWLVTVLQILHWFNPLLWPGFARLRADRELACDELALLRAGDNLGTAYGETIVKLLENLSRPTAIPGLVGILEDKKQMRRRISMIVNFRRPGRWSALAVILLVAIAATALTDAQTNKPANPTARIKVENDVTDIPGMMSSGPTGNGYDPYFIGHNNTPNVQVDVPGLHTNDLARDPNRAWGKKYFTGPAAGVPSDLTGLVHDPANPKVEDVNHTKRFSAVVQQAAAGLVPAMAALQSPPTPPGMAPSPLRPIPGEQVKGIVLTPNGKPATNAQVILQTEMSSPELRNGTLAGSPLPFADQQLATTGPDGSFTLQLYEGWESVIAVNNEGYAQVSLEQLELSPQITLQKWGRIEGSLRLGNHAGTNELVGLLPEGMKAFSPIPSHYKPRPLWYAFGAYQSRTDGQGRFAFDFVPPGMQNLYREIPLDGGELQMNLLSQIEVKPGKTSVTNVSVNGRTVVGRLKFSGATPKDLTKSIGYLIGVPTGHHGRFTVFDIAADGTFRAEYIRPGTYNFRFEQYRHPLPDENHYLSVRGIIGFSQHEFQVPEPKTPDDDSIVDAGTVELE